MTSPPNLRPRHVLHIGTERRWRGGENQLRHLVEQSPAEFRHSLAYPQGSACLERFAGVIPTLPLRRTAPTSLSDILALRRFCHAEGVDLIDAHSGNAHTLALLATTGSSGPDIVVHRRIASPIRSSPYNRWKYRSDRVQRFIAISTHIERMLLDYGIPSERITVVRSGVPVRTFPDGAREEARRALRRSVPAIGDSILIGNASALTKEKGYPVLLRALRLLRDRTRLPFHCVVAGAGPLRDPLEEQARNLDIADAVTFLGHVDRIEQILLALDILAMPSEREGLGTLLLDATLAGCAVAATRVGGIPEVILHERTGLLSPAGNAEDLAFNLQRLAEDSHLRESLNREAVEHVRLEFSVERMVRENLHVYRDVLASRERA